MTGHTHQTQGHEHDRSHDHDPAKGHDHPHDHDHPEGRLRRVIGIFVGHSHDPGDSIDDALTSDARGIRALKVSLALLGITAVAQLAVVLVSGSVALLADTITTSPTRSPRSRYGSPSPSAPGRRPGATLSATGARRTSPGSSSC